MADYILHGAEASPYSVKMRAALRARRLPYRWTHPRTEPGLFTHVKAPVIPVMRFPDGSWHNDSTPLLRALEVAHPARSLVPDEEAHAFTAWLLEDFADEWGTKIMFHERWSHAADRDVSARAIVLEGNLGLPEAELDRAAAAFGERQVGRMALVGCTPENAPVIKETVERVQVCIGQVAADGPFLFGSRPSVADVGWYGQLWQLARDPTPRAVMRDIHPRVFAWLEHLDDTSGIEGDWRAGELSTGTLGLVHLAGTVHLPFLAANAAALADGRDRVELELLGRPYAQAPFKYQARCLADLRALYAALSPPARERVDALIGDPGALTPPT